MIFANLDHTSALRRRTHTALTGEIAREGILIRQSALSPSNAMWLDEQTREWMTARLGLTPVETEDGVEWRSSGTKSERADKIAKRHDCEINGSGNRTAIQVRPRWQLGWPQDARRVEACLAELEACGISTTGWLR